ncbi:MAG: SUMF1/EgtB/PvdO family nonheme iron enzyme [Candidatus Wallbacteria bacterium]|nr:SUMF1/EgtB/PvdO family nonheme iron enzyme [Candidatus Wallbacteria bacterium]
MKIILFFCLSLAVSLYAESRMIYIPEGNFKQGLSDAKASFLIQNGGDITWTANCTPQREVYLASYYIDRYEVTRAEYKAFEPNHYYRDQEAGMPVTNITWYDASEYAKWAGKRLPTEEEWEKAARGSFGRIFPWGDEPDFQSAHTKSLIVPGYNGLVPVEMFKKDISPYGVYDMGGNACEWTGSFYLKYPGNGVFNRKYGRNYYVIRGGSFLYGHLETFCSSRKCGKPDLKNIDIGFRCVMSVENYIKNYGHEKHLQNLRAQSKN